MSRKDRRGAKKRSYTLPVAVILLVIFGVIAYFIFTSSSIGGDVNAGYIGQPVSSTILNDLNGVTDATLNSVGPGPAGVTGPQSTASSAGVLPSVMTSGGKPEVLYMGAEYCPYCGVERWAMIVALDKFGTFSGIQYMQSSSTDVYPNTSTFTFLSATYTSNYITFVTVEQYDRNDNPLQTATANETALATKYDSAGSIPFVDFANQYVLVGSQYTPPQLRVGASATGAPYNWTQIASQLNTPSSIFAQNVDGAANKLISTICKIDSNQPASVCNETFASTAGYRFPVSSGQAPVVSDVLTTGPASSAVPSRFTARD